MHIFRLRYINIVYYLSILLITTLLTSCKQDQVITNIPPETRLFWDKVNLSGNNRLQSLVHLYWSGDDQDGFVTGYEISTDKIQWSFVTRMDSIFQFPVIGTADTADIRFYVRSIDNNHLADPTPSELTLPVKNTAPSVDFDTLYTPKSGTLPAFTLKLSAFDIDGAETLDRIEIKANDGEWFLLPSKAGILSFVAEQPQNNGSISPALVFLSDETVPLKNKLSGLKIGSDNVFYARAIDLGGLTSKIDTSGIFKIIAQQSDVLMLDGWVSQPSGALIMKDKIENSTGVRIDYVSLLNPQNIPPLTATTYRLLFTLYQEIFWITETNATQMTILENSEGILQDALNNKKKVFLCAPLDAALDSLSSLFRYSPMERLTDEKNGLMKAGAKLIPQSSELSYPVLLNSTGAFISGINPFIPKANAEIIYSAELIRGDGKQWSSGNSVIARTKSPNGKTNFIVSTIPLHLFLNDNGEALKKFFQNVHEEFDW